MSKAVKSTDLKEEIYLLKSEATPISFQLRSRHTHQRPLQWFDEEEKYERSLRYVTNQSTIFEDEQKEFFVLGSVVFEDGELRAKPQQTTLKEFMAKHPDNVANGGHTFFLFDPEKKAQEDLSKELAGYEAIACLLELDVADLEAIGRVYFASNVDSLTSGELKRDLIRKAKENPAQFMELANDSDVKMLNLVNRVIDYGLVKIKDDSVSVVWAANGKHIVKLPFSTDPNKTFASYLKTDEGVELQKAFALKLNK
jgi:hypothetical protein